MMKVAIVTLGRSHLINLARLLDQRADVEVTFYTMMPKSRCRMFGYKGRVVSLLLPIGLGEVIISRIPGINPYKRSALRFRLRRVFDKLVAQCLRRCDVLIGLNGCAVESSKKAAKKYNAITICDQGSSHIKTQDAVHYTYSDAPLSAWNTEYMLKHYDAVKYLMAPSVYVKNSDIGNGIEKERILYNPYGVNLKMFKPAPKPDDKSYDVIMVGSWWKHKGCDMLAEACINRLGVKLLHVGAVVDCVLPDSPLFKHVDFVAERDLPTYYSKAKIFAMPSLDEGYGLVLLQAAACGLILVGSSRTGAPDTAALLVNSPECITIDEPLSVDTIADAIRRGLEIAHSLPEGKRKPYGDKIENISWEAYGDRWYNILEEIVKK